MGDDTDPRSHAESASAVLQPSWTSQPSSPMPEPWKSLLREETEEAEHRRRLGTAGIYRRCPLDRHLRDLITINRHVLAQVRTLEVVGGMWFGAEPPLPVL